MWSKTDSVNCLTMNEFSGKIRPKMGNTLRLLMFFKPVWFGSGFGDVVVRIKNVIPQADFLAASHQTLLWMNFSYLQKWSLPKDEKFSSLRIFKIILQPLKTKGLELRLLGRPDTHQLKILTQVSDVRFLALSINSNLKLLLGSYRFQWMK